MGSLSAFIALHRAWLGAAYDRNGFHYPVHFERSRETPRKASDTFLDFARNKRVVVIMIGGNISDMVADILTKKELQIELAPLRADIGLLKWMAGVNSALTVGVLLKLLLG